MCLLSSSFFFFNDTATTEIYTLSLHDALPIFGGARSGKRRAAGTSSRARWPYRSSPAAARRRRPAARRPADRKSTRLNSSHLVISYAVFCLKKKKLNGDSAPGKVTRTRPKHNG